MSSARREEGRGVSTVRDLVQWGLRGAPLPRRRAWALRAGAVVAFLLLWSLASGLVAVGFATGAVLAQALGLPAGHFRVVRSLLGPIVEILRPVPPLAMLPLF